MINETQKVEVTELHPDYSNLESSGRFVIEASAGTGKTYSILRMYLCYLLDRWKEDEEIEIDRILLVTFTNAATNELKERLLQFLQECYAYCMQEQPLENTDDSIVQIIHAATQSGKLTLSNLSSRFKHFLADFDRAPVYTIHAFCGRIQTEWFPQVGLPIESRNRVDADELLEEICKDYWRQHMHSPNPNELIFANYLRNKFKTPVNDSKGISGSSLLKAVKGIERYLSIEIDPKPISKNAITKLLQDYENAFNQLKSSFSGRDIKQCILDEYQRAGINGNAESRAKNISIFLQDDFEFNFCEQLRFLTPDFVLDKAKNADYKCSKWLIEVEKLEKIQREFKETENIILSFILNDIHSKVIDKCTKESLTTHDLDLKLTLQGFSQNKDLASKLASQFPCILVDEFQDTDKVQYELFDRIFRASKRKNSAMYFIGDPKQSIYRFRNADIETYLKAKREARKVYTLKTNYRSSNEAVASVNHLFSLGNHPTSVFDEADIPFKRVGVKGTKLSLQSSNTSENSSGIRLIIPEWDAKKKNNSFKKAHALKWIAFEIEKYLSLNSPVQFFEEETNESFAVQPKDIAVIVKSHKDGEELKDLLANRGISSVLYNRPTVFASVEARWLRYIFEATLEPKNLNHIKRALSTPFFNIEVDQFVEWATVKTASEKLIEYQQQFARWNDLWNQKSTLHFIQHILQSQTTRARIVGLEQGDRSLTNLLQIAELLDDYENKKGASPLSVYHFLSLKIQRAKQNEENEEDEVRLDTDEQLVKIMTVFRSKGLEFPIVFTALDFNTNSNKFSDWILEPSIIPSKTSAIKDELKEFGADQIIVGTEKQLNISLNVLGQSISPSVNKYQDIEQCREAIRQMYVAVTRAKYQTVIVEYFGGQSNYQPIISAHLLLGKESEKDKKSTKKNDGEAFYYNKETVYKTISSLNSDKEYSIEPTSFEMIKDELEHPLQPLKQNLSELKTESKNDGNSLPQFEMKAQWRVSSYSGLKKYLSHSTQAESTEEVEDDPKSIVDEPKLVKIPHQELHTEYSIFDFEKGTTAGTFMHELFELLEFHRFNDAEHRKEVIIKACNKYGYDVDKWFSALDKMVYLAMTKSIQFDSTSIQLGQLQPNELLREMEFVFDHHHFDLNSLLQIINPEEPISPIQLPALKGYLTGFIDLCFLHHGKFYLLDYKSNYLGDNATYYGKEALSLDMKKHRYDLQFHLYAYAMDRILKSRVQNYSYETHFGGVCYLYLRGLNEKRSEGIYTTNVPDYSKINKMRSLLGDMK